MDSRTIRIGEFVRDVRTGSDTGSLQRKYRLTRNGLVGVFDKLIEGGFLTTNDVKACSEPRPSTAWTCPACERPQSVAWDVCPICGVIIAKFVSQSQPVVHEVRQESEAKSLIGMISSARHNLNCLVKDRMLWAVCLAGIIPLVLVTASPDVQIILFCGLTGMIWATFFKNFVAADSGGWALPTLAMVFTGFVGTCHLLAAYFILPPFYTRMAQSADLLVSLSGYVFHVGVCEELCKIAPAVFYVLWKKWRGERVSPRNVIIIAMFSAIGFSATENVGYAHKAVLHASECAKKTSQEILVAGVKSAMVNYLFRSLALVFLHAVLSGIFGCFLAISVHMRRLWPVLFILGLAASAGLHGIYDWLVDRSLLAAATLVWLSFVLFYALIARPRTVPSGDALVVNVVNG